MRLSITFALLALACSKPEPTESVPSATLSVLPVVLPKPPPEPTEDENNEELAKAPVRGLSPKVTEWQQWPPPERPEDFDLIVGRWIGVEEGDAIPKGPGGGAVVEGGYRVEIVKGRKGSKTPWNLTFWAPGPGHMKSDTISGGCGFYLASKRAYCRGYGLPTQDRAHAMPIHFDSTSATPITNVARIRITIGSIAQMVLRREWAKPLRGFDTP